MLSLGYDRWFKTNLIKESYSNITDPFNVIFDIKTPVMDLSFDAAADYTAKLIAEKYKNLHLCLSGGLDSEFVAKVLCRNHIHFTPIIFLPFADSETWYALKFCDENRLEPKILNFPTDSLILAIFKKATKLKVPVDESLVPSIILESIGDPTAKILTGYGEPFNNSKYYEKMGSVLEISDHDFYLNLEYDDLHPGSFLTYTPEVFKAIVRDIDCELDTQTAKSKLYTILPRTKIYTTFKYDKFEMCQRNNYLNNIDLKFHRHQKLKNFRIEKQSLLSML